MYDDFFAKAFELEKAGETFVTAVVVRAEKPTSGKPGDRAIVTAAGELFGWIGGSCARPTVIEEARAALEDGQSRLIRLSSEPGAQQERIGLTDMAMTCFSGGTMEIYLEPHQPRPQMLIVGDQAVARTLVALGRAMGYRAIGVASAGENSGVEGAEEVLADLDVFAEAIDTTSFVVVATHGDHDEVAVEKALGAGAGYVGLVASPKRSESIREYLDKRGLGTDQLAALHAPAGLDIQARRPDEIALSILAEIVQIRRQSEDVTTADEGAAEGTETVVSAPVAESTAIDPICGMTVQIESAQHVFEHAGKSYYFCCGGCRARFANDPDAILAGLEQPV